MEFLYYLLTGLGGGVLGGMGMGGGTILIPLLTIIFRVGQHTAQAINLISFLPMAIVAIIFHIKNKMIDFNKILYVIIPGIVTCFISCFLAKNIGGDTLKRCFGGFLLLLGGYQIISAFIKKQEK